MTIFGNGQIGLSQVKNLLLLKLGWESSSQSPKLKLTRTWSRPIYRQANLIRSLPV